MSLPFFLAQFSWCQNPLLLKLACSFPSDAASLPPVTVVCTLQVRCMHPFLEQHEPLLLHDPSDRAFYVNRVPSCRNSCVLLEAARKERWFRGSQHTPPSYSSVQLGWRGPGASIITTPGGSLMEELESMLIPSGPSSSSAGSPPSSCLPRSSRVRSRTS